MSVPEDLIIRLTNSLETEAQRGVPTGNRMHHPMLISTNGDNAKEVFLVCEKIFKRMWPQTYNKTAFIKYSSAGSAQFYDLKTDSAVSVAELQGQLDDIRKSRNDSFSDQTVWRFYNIIDTSSITNMNEFDSLYSFLNKFKKIAIDTVSSMLIVVIDESLEKRSFSSRIRQYLADTVSLYDGVVVLSNQKIDKSLVKNNEELYRVVAGLITLSNNDAISTHDDEDYNERVNCLFGNRLTLSHSLQKKPDEKICILIVNKILEEAERILGNGKNADIQDWKSILGIDNTGEIKTIADRFNAIGMTLNEDELLYLPYKTIPDFKCGISQCSFASLKSVLYDGTFENYIDKNCRQTEDTPEIKELLSGYESDVRSRVSAKDCEALTTTMINELADSLFLPSLDESKTVAEYFKSYVLNSFKKEVFKPFLRNLLLDMQGEAKPTIKRFNSFLEEFSSLIPISGFSSNLLGMYGPIIENYLASGEGEQRLLRLVSPGNEENDFSECLEKMVLSIVAENKDYFYVSYTDWLARYLGFAGEKVYRRIRETFENDLNDNIYLFGTFPKIEMLKLFAFHTTDADGTNGTGLYGDCLKAYNGQHVQFINTGFDDEIEGFRLFDLNGNSLV